MLACLRNDLPVVQARGYDDLPAEILQGVSGTHVPSLEREKLQTAFSASMQALLREGSYLPETAGVALRLGPLD
jgi:hypothetical protein